MKTYDVIVLGAGAAGLMCAIEAGRRGRSVLVLDRSNKVGKKILMSGGGRCNFTNLHISPERFLSANPHFCKSALSRYTQWHFIEMVEQHGIEYFEKETVNGLSGQLFCRLSSKQIVAMLLDECAKVSADVRTKHETTKVHHRDGFELQTEQGRFAADALVVACGGLSIPSLGGSGFGYELGRQFGLTVLPTTAGLVPFTFSDSTLDMCKRLAGVSCEVVLNNERNRFREDILFTHRGLSGPAVLQLSSYWRPGEAFDIDLLPDDSGPDLLKHWKHEQPRATLRTPLSGLLPRKLVLELQDSQWPEKQDLPLAEWTDQALTSIGQLLNRLTLKPAATEGYRTAEVTLGGIDTRKLSSKTMESTTPGLFFIGEVVDVTGHLGGFNFQWAWSSGYAAGCAV